MIKQKKYVWGYMLKENIPQDQDQIIQYQFGKKTCYITKVNKFYVKKG